jgi:hypothetical protein
MTSDVPHRDFLKSMPAAVYAPSTAMRGTEQQAKTPPDDRSAVWCLAALPADAHGVNACRYPYFMYFDRKMLPWRLW